MVYGERERQEQRSGYDTGDTVVAGHGYEAKRNAQDVRNPMVVVVWVEAHYAGPVTEAGDADGWVMEKTRLQ